MNRNNAGRFAPKPKTDWIEALTPEELDLLNEQLEIVVRFKHVDPSTEDEAADYLAARSLVHWLSRIGTQRQGAPACECEACSEVDAALAQHDGDEADQARAEIALHRSDERERRARDRAAKLAPIAPAALQTAPVTPGLGSEWEEI